LNEGEASLPDTAAAYYELVDAHYQFIYRLLFWLHGDRSLAEDLTQETFLRAWQGAPQRRSGRASDRAWLAAIARRVALDHRRNRRLEAVPLEAASEVSGGGLSVPEQVVADAERAQLYSALLALPEPYRSALALTRVEGLTTLEAAQTLGIPQGTLKWRVAAGLRMLRTSLQGTVVDAEEGTTHVVDLQTQ
jgi:RNA polymerase sigma-70 factor (ECF subfamily)